MSSVLSTVGRGTIRVQIIGASGQGCVANVEGVDVADVGKACSCLSRTRFSIFLSGRKRDIRSLRLVLRCEEILGKISQTAEDGPRLAYRSVYPPGLQHTLSEYC